MAADGQANPLRGSEAILNPYQPSLTKLRNGVSLLNAPSASRNVGVFLIVRAGSRDETAQTSGLAHYLEHMFFKGTAKRPTTKIISYEIDSLGASTNAYTDTEEVAYYAEGPATALAELADVITDMLCRPLFAAEEVERERNVVLQELSMRLADPDGWIWDRLGTVARNDHSEARIFQHGSGTLQHQFLVIDDQGC